MTLIFISVFSALAQNEKLAEDYFQNGEFEKAENLYKTLYENQPDNFEYFDRLIQCFQEQQKYEEAQKLITSILNKTTWSESYVNVDLAYNYELQGLEEQANTYYEKAIDYIKKNPNNGYQIAKRFQDHQKLDYALQSYELMMAVYPTANFYNQIAIIYGEKGEIEKMFETYLDMLSKQSDDVRNIQRFMGRFLTEDNQGENNVLLRKILVRRIQNEPRKDWYEMLSWLYLQQKDYTKSFIQEKSIYKLYNSDLKEIINLGKITFDDGDYETCSEIFNFVLEQDTSLEDVISAHYYLLESQKALHENVQKIDEAYQLFFEKFGTGSNTSSVQTSYAQFLTFYENNPDKAIEVLENALQNNLDRFQKAEIKIQMGDVLVFVGKYNQALITYTQVQNELKNHPLAQTARYKVAQTSYFEGDFEWANVQLKVLKKGTTKLIANDAIDLSMLISDNIAQDSVQTALKSYAKADLLAYQNKYRQAIDTLDFVLKNFKGHPIEDEALYKQADLFQKLGDYTKAEQNYLSILQLNQDDILIDDALYQLALLYDEKLFAPEKAKTYYEKIVLEQPSSIYLVPARNRFRELRGDELIP